MSFTHNVFGEFTIIYIIPYISLFVKGYIKVNWKDVTFL